MQNKFVGFARNMFLSLILIASSSFWFYKSFPLHVTCELQNDETYTCVAQHELFGIAPIKVQADNVVSIEWDLKCSSGTKRGCAYVSQFITTTGEKVKLSNFFTSNQDKVEELVQTIDSLMKEKSPTIDYTTSRQSILLDGGLFFCLAPILLIAPFLKLFPSKKGEGPRTLISWGKKEE